MPKLQENFLLNEKKYFLDEKNIFELKKFCKQLIKNFGEINNDDKFFLNEKNLSEDFFIEFFKKILKRRAENGEKGIIFLINEIRKNQELSKIFEEDFLFVEKILDISGEIKKILLK
ncbi:hypothetical protein LR002_00390 [Candidatus Gracilibacteria bacterium]|nr:hypothetical protein [Candidatus Gracilibacteria bacterium]